MTHTQTSIRKSHEGQSEQENSEITQNSNKKSYTLVPKLTNLYTSNFK